MIKTEPSIGREARLDSGLIVSEATAKEDAESKLPFTKGELVPWKGIWFRVETVLPNGLLLSIAGATVNQVEKTRKAQKRLDRRNRRKK